MIGVATHTGTFEASSAAASRTLGLIPPAQENAEQQGEEEESSQEPVVVDLSNKTIERRAVYRSVQSQNQKQTTDTSGGDQQVDNAEEGGESGGSQKKQEGPPPEPPDLSDMFNDAFFSQYLRSAGGGANRYLGAPASPGQVVPSSITFPTVTATGRGDYTVGLPSWSDSTMPAAAPGLALGAGFTDSSGAPGQGGSGVSPETARGANSAADLLGLEQVLQASLTVSAGLSQLASLKIQEMRDLAEQLMGKVGIPGKSPVDSLVNDGQVSA